MNRALIAAFLSESPTILSNPSFSEDSQIALNLIQALGAYVRIHPNEIYIRGEMNPTGEILNCGQSGSILRLFTPVAALFQERLTLTGNGRLFAAPVSRMEAALHSLGAQFRSTDGSCPVTVTGPLTGGPLSMDGSSDPSLVAGLLMALPKAHGDSTLRIGNPNGIPPVAITLKVLNDFGIRIDQTDYAVFSIPGDQPYRLKNNKHQYRIEGEWKGAAFMMVAGAIGGSVSLTGLNCLSIQSDKKILNALTSAGADVSLSNHQITIKKNKLQAFAFDAASCPGLFPPLTVLACNCTGLSTINGVHRLIQKGNDRSRKLQQLILSLGGQARIQGDTMEIAGTPLKGGLVYSHDDPRIAMAAAIAAINAENSVTIHNYHCVTQSYPNFFTDLQKIGANIYC